MLQLPKAVLKNYIQAITLNLRGGSLVRMNRAKAEVRMLLGKSLSEAASPGHWLKKTRSYWILNTILPWKPEEQTIKVFHLLRLNHLGLSRKGIIILIDGKSPVLTTSVIGCILRLWHMQTSWLWKDFPSQDLSVPRDSKQCWSPKDFKCKLTNPDPPSPQPLQSGFNSLGHYPQGQVPDN